MDLLRLPWNGGQGRPQFALDQLFRRDDRAGAGAAVGGPAAAERGGADLGNIHMMQNKDYKGTTSPLQKVLDGTYTILLYYVEKQ